MKAIHLLKLKRCFPLWMMLFLISCNSSPKNEKRHDLFTLDATETYLNFPIDENTRLPKFCLWTFEESGKEYLAFSNRGVELLFYDISNQSLVKKVSYDIEGDNGVGLIYSFYVTDFNHIYIPNSSIPVISVTDSTGCVRSVIKYSEMENGKTLVPVLAHTITYSPMIFLGDSIYISQSSNPRLGDDYVAKSPLGAMIINSEHLIKPTPLKYIPQVSPVENIPYSTGGEKVSVCFNGKEFVYSDEMSDSIYTLSSDFQTIRRYEAKSRYITHPKIETLSSDSDIETILKRKCELPTYGNLIYDKYRDVYYRFAFPQTELEKERSYMDIYHNGRKQFSIIILDKEMKVVGEKMFPAYTYNPYLLFVREDGLYLGASHFKRPDFDENFLRFEKIKLVSL